ncbi:hypothetical protein IGI04_014718 [Brassica rapa subsp. trilocularis]|uniref:Uncharacterized protein n=1 Tax=Brassica rapa subsp. trilocularis TaxID=1813537 RepID=A0ABQ7MMZ5_BRACM|nr:hypothetical protein IGI04_014718 [Brassica rapa subsp. trilocularis]
MNGLANTLIKAWLNWQFQALQQLEREGLNHQIKPGVEKLNKPGAEKLIKLGAEKLIIVSDRAVLVSNKEEIKSNAPELKLSFRDLNYHPNMHGKQGKHDVEDLKNIRRHFKINLGSLIWCVISRPEALEYQEASHLSCVPHQSTRLDTDRVFDSLFARIIKAFTHLQEIQGVTAYPGSYQVRSREISEALEYQEASHLSCVPHQSTRLDTDRVFDSLFARIIKAFTHLQEIQGVTAYPGSYQLIVEVMLVLLKSSESASREEDVEEMKECRPTVNP